MSVISSSKSSLNSNNSAGKDILFQWIQRNKKLGKKPQYNYISEDSESHFESSEDSFRLRSNSEHLPRSKENVAPDHELINTRSRLLKMIEYNNQESRGSAFLNWLGHNKKGFASSLTRKNSDDSAYNTESEGSQYGYDHHKRRGSHYGLPQGYSRFPPIYGSEHGTPRQRPMPLRGTMSDSEVHKHKSRFAREQPKESKLTKKVIKGNWVVEDEKCPFGASKALENIQKKKTIQVPAFDEYKKFTGVEVSESEKSDVEEEEVKKKKLIKHKKKHRSKERRRTVSESDLTLIGETEPTEKKSKKDKKRDPEPDTELPVNDKENNDETTSSEKKHKKSKKKKKKDKSKEEDKEDVESKEVKDKSKDKQEHISEENNDQVETKEEVVETVKSKKQKDKSKKKKKKDKDKDKESNNSSESKNGDNDVEKPAEIDNKPKGEPISNQDETRPVSSASSIMDNVDDYLFQKIQRKQTKDGISKKDFGKLLKKYWDKKYSHIKSEKEEEQKMEDKVTAIMESSKKDKEHISNLRKAEQDKVSDKLQKKLEAKKKKKEKKRKEMEKKAEDEGKEEDKEENGKQE